MKGRRQKKKKKKEELVRKLNCKREIKVKTTQERPAKKRKKG